MSNWLDEVEAQVDETSPYYLPRLIAEIRSLRLELAAASRAPGVHPREQLVEDVLQRIESSHRGSIGSIGNTYMPQIGVDEVTRWRAQLAALLPPASTPETAPPRAAVSAPLPVGKYCEMCDRWFNRGKDCPECGYPLRKGA